MESNNQLPLRSSTTVIWYILLPSKASLYYYPWPLVPKAHPLQKQNSFYKGKTSAPTFHKASMVIYLAVTNLPKECRLRHRNTLISEREFTLTRLFSEADHTRTKHTEPSTRKSSPEHCFTAFMLVPLYFAILERGGSESSWPTPQGSVTNYSIILVFHLSHYIIMSHIMMFQSTMDCIYYGSLIWLGWSWKIPTAWGFYYTFGLNTQTLLCHSYF